MPACSRLDARRAREDSVRRFAAFSGPIIAFGRSGVPCFLGNSPRPRKVTFITPDAQRDASTRPRGTPGGTPARVPDDVPNAGWADDARARDSPCNDDGRPARRSAAACDARPGVGRASAYLGGRARPVVGRATSSAPAALPALFWSAVPRPHPPGRAPPHPAPAGTACPSTARISGAGPADTEFFSGRRKGGARAWNAFGIERRRAVSGDGVWCCEEYFCPFRPRPQRRPHVEAGDGRERLGAEIRQGQERRENGKQTGQRCDLPDGG